MTFVDMVLIVLLVDFMMRLVQGARLFKMTGLTTSQREAKHLRWSSELEMRIMNLEVGGDTETFVKNLESFMNNEKESN